MPRSASSLGICNINKRADSSDIFARSFDMFIDAHVKTAGSSKRGKFDNGKHFM